MKSPSNPFVTTGYAGANWFCDRNNETNSLLKSIKNDQSVTLTSVRRMGKSSLIQHVFSQLPKDYIGIYVDVRPTDNSNDLFNSLATAVIGVISEKSKQGKKLWQFLKLLRPVVSFDPLTGFPQLTTSLAPHENEIQISLLLQFLDSQSEKYIIAFDEFQQILKYPEANTDAWLHSNIQPLLKTIFIFSGGQQNLMSELFDNPSRPFYQTTTFLKINKIQEEYYIEFIMDHFLNKGRIITEEQVIRILNWANSSTYYVQLLCNRLFSSGEKKITPELIMKTIRFLLKEQENTFFDYRHLLTTNQWELLKAIAYDMKVYEPTSKSFLLKYKLGSSATVIQSLKALISKELVYCDYDETSRLFYSVHDILFQHWVKPE